MIAGREGGAVPGCVALVPMRHRSERVKGKNYRLFAGRPLYHYVITTLMSCARIEAIVVNTDSDEIRSGLERNFPDVRILERPPGLVSGMVSMNEIIHHDIGEVEADVYLQTHCTNPFLSTESVDRALDLFLSRKEENDSLFSVSRFQKRLWSGEGAPLLHNPDELLRTQDLPKVYEENSCIYLFTRRSFLEKRNRIGRKPILFEMGREESWDIDDEFDFTAAEQIMKEKIQKGGQPR
jgi:CMP-N-acetylneuraminic acid synthetase